ncbi:PD-(D/E)XK motif protein [Streptomyces sp. NPDC055157]
MNAQILEELWAGLPKPAGHLVLSAERVSGDGLWAAIDAEGTCHLLVEVPSGAEAPPTITKGLRLRVGEHQVAGRPVGHFLDLACSDPAAVKTFAAVGSDIVQTAGPVAAIDRIDAVAEVLDRWKWFWRVDPSRLNESGALGLFAELWFLVRWVGVNPENIEAWTASEGSRHDFQWPEVSVEVKASSQRSGGVHTIRSLDQLADPETGELHLFSLRVVRDRLSNNTLPRLVDQVSTTLAGYPHIREEFLMKVGRRGYSPAHRKSLEVPYRVIEEGLYRVADDFPRLTRDDFPAGLPDAIVGVSYDLDIAACGPWLQSTTPNVWPPGSA